MNIPALRFPEFSDTWEKIKLIELSTNGFSNGIFNDPKKVGTGYRLINVKDMYVGDIIDVNRLTLVDIDKKEFIKNKVEYGDIFFTRSSLVKDGIAYSNVNLSHAEDLTFDGHLIRMRPNPEKSSPSFLAYNFTIPAVRAQLIKRGKTTTMTTIGQEDIASVEIIVPAVAEQTKIATFLTAVDDRLNQLKQKKFLLEQYKKGVMQKFFDQEIRFKDDEGNEYPDWEVTKFGSLYSFKSTNSFSRDNLNYESGEVKNIHYGDIHTKFKPLLDTANENIPYINDEMDISKIPNDNYCKAGDLVIADASEDYNDIGKAIEVYKLNNEKVVAGLHTILAKPDLSKIALGFGAYLMKAEYIHFQIRIISQGTKVLGLSSNRLSGISVKLPCVNEQTKIANFLSAIDEKISLCNTQIAKTEQYKKGLLQQMFV